jgi:uncharacterized membrane protein
MNAATLSTIITRGAITGMRSMAGPATLAFRREGMLKPFVAALAVGEMLADKTSIIGDRIAPFPLAGRALMGALVGGVLAHESRSSVMRGACIGGAASVVAAHLAYRLRRRLPLPSALSGVLEDAVVIAVGAWTVAQSTDRST